MGFNSEGEALGAKAICYLSHAKSSDTADVVVVALNGVVPEMKYTGTKQPSKNSCSLVNWPIRRSAALRLAIKLSGQKRSGRHLVRYVGHSVRGACSVGLHGMSADTYLPSLWRCLGQIFLKP